MQVIQPPIALSFTSGCTSRRIHTRQESQVFSIPTPITKGIRKSVYAGSDESKLSWLTFRGYASSSKCDPRSPVNVAFRTVTFVNRSPVTLEFDSDEAYEPDDEEVFDEDEDEGYGKMI